MIREATESDLDRIVEMGENFHAISPWSCFAFSPDKFRAQAANMIREGSSTIIVNDTLTGMIGMVSGPVYFSENASVAQEAFWWCEDPKDSLRLLQEAEKWASDIGVNGVCMVRLNGVSPGLEAYYCRRGYALTESYYLKGL